MREGAACSRRGARAVLLCITCTCFKSGEDSLLPWLRCGSVATRLFFCQLFLQGLQQMCKESVPIAAEHLHLPCGRTPPRLATWHTWKANDLGALWPLTHLKKPHSWCVQLLSKKYISRFINFKFFSLYVLWRFLNSGTRHNFAWPSAKGGCKVAWPLAKGGSPISVVFGTKIWTFKMNCYFV